MDDCSPVDSFERKEILRVVHSLASYRPSLIALQYVPVPIASCGIQGGLADKRRMPMSEEDEVFLEKSFQRTLIVSLPVASFRYGDNAVLRHLVGTGEADFVLRDPYCRLASNGGGLLCQSRILLVGQTE